jgi:hypothetical protein
MRVAEHGPGEEQAGEAHGDDGERGNERDLEGFAESGVASGLDGVQDPGDDGETVEQPLHGLVPNSEE